MYHYCKYRLSGITSGDGGEGGTVVGRNVGGGGISISSLANIPCYVDNENPRVNKF